MKMYMICELDSESYSDARYSFYASFEDAKKAALKACIDWNEKADIDRRNDGLWNLYRLCAVTEDAFYVTEVFPVDVKNGNNHILVWHHAYEGVDFRVIQTGTQLDCKNRLEEDINEMVIEFDAERCADNIVDTDNEWQVWDIVEIREVIER